QVPGMSPRSECVVVAFPGPDTDHPLYRRNPDLAVADLSGAGRADDGVNHSLGKLLIDQYLDADLRDEFDRILGSAVDLGVPPLPAIPLHFGDGPTQHTHGLTR